jgi:hypothetical protein
MTFFGRYKETFGRYKETRSCSKTSSSILAPASGKIVGDYAISVASRLEAHITGIAIAFVPDIQAAGTALIPVEKIEALQRNNEAAAETVVERRKANTPHEYVSCR